MDVSLNTSIGGTPVNLGYDINTRGKIVSKYSIDELLLPYDDNHCLTYTEITNCKNLTVLENSLRPGTVAISMYGLNELVCMTDIEYSSTLPGGDIETKTKYNVSVEIKRSGSDFTSYIFDYVKFCFTTPCSVTFYAYGSAYTVATVKTTPPTSYADFTDCQIDDTTKCPIVTTLRLTDTEYDNVKNSYDTYGLVSIQKYCVADGYNFSDDSSSNISFVINWYLTKA